MNRTLTFGSLAVICIFSATTMAQALRTKPRAEETVVRPGSTNIQTQQTSKSGLFQNIGATTAKPAVPANDNQAQVKNSCQGKLADITSKLSDGGIKVSYATTQSLIQDGYVNLDPTKENCMGGIVGMNDNAQENYLQMQQHVRTQGVKPGVINHQVRAAGLAEAKNDDAGVTQKTSAQQELATSQALQQNCNL